MALVEDLECKLARLSATGAICIIPIVGDYIERGYIPYFYCAIATTSEQMTVVLGPLDVVYHTVMCDGFKPDFSAHIYVE